ncbi:MAG TPA: MBOAT family O-acyltransferase, partial [Nannocystaceae bacterium]|nr:MBOAT family O-acyltransferase [Nannocystaceae bacterium]
MILHKEVALSHRIPAHGMLFQTFDFLLFAIPVIVVFWALAGRPVARVLFLLAASWFFYAAGPQTDPPPAPWWFVGLLIASTVLDFVCGREIHRLDGDASSPDEFRKRRAKQRRAAWLATSLVGNLGVLAYFKYVNFFATAFADLAGTLGVAVEPLHLDVVLPLGISFYTFQSLSYTIDVYRGKLEAEPSLARFALFVAFFPQLVAGPIVRAKELLPQLRVGPRFSRAGIETGAFRICKGLVKKVVLGDWIAAGFTDRIFDSPETFTSPELMLALYAYTLQIYADFSGYSDMAIGLGLMLGFRLPENFNRPYQSRDIAEYWRRWHMTLASWLRDYVFFPLLVRLGARAGYLALWLSIFLIGLWHGASWNFVAYGCIHAFAMVFNRWNRVRDRSRSWRRLLVAWPLGLVLGVAAVAGLGRALLLLSWSQSLALAGLAAASFLFVCRLPLTGGRLVGIVHVLATLHFVVIARIFFRAPDLATARSFTAGLLAFDGHGIRPGLASSWTWLA